MLFRRRIRGKANPADKILKIKRGNGKAVCRHHLSRQSSGKDHRFQIKRYPSLQSIVHNCQLPIAMHQQLYEKSECSRRRQATAMIRISRLINDPDQRQWSVIMINQKDLRKRIQRKRIQRNDGGSHPVHCSARVKQFRK